MTDRDAQLLVKLLNLTDSDNDFEALIAIRKVNLLLKRHGKTWSDMYQPKPVGWETKDTYWSDQYQAIFI